jgi:hypothetical protein
MKKFSTLLAVMTLAALPVTSFAAINIPGGGQQENLPQGITSFAGFIEVFKTIITYVFTLLLIFAVIFIIMAAFTYLTAGGDEEKVSKAHQKIIYAVVAIAVAFLAQGISYVVGELLNTGGAGVDIVN